MKFRLIAAALAAYASPTLAQTQAKPDVDPAVWVVKDTDTTVYLFGTIHLLDGKSEWFNDEVRKAFDLSQEVELEALAPDDPATLQPVIMKYALDRSGRTLSSRLSPEMKARLDKELAAAGLPAGAFDAFEPWFAAMNLAMLSVRKLGVSGDHGPEGIIEKAAKASGKKLGELEGFEKQLAMLDAIPEEQQMQFLTETLNESEKVGTIFPAMIEAWGKGDVERLAAILNEGIDDIPGLAKALLTDRNARWAEWIETRMKRPGSVFVAVGAGHLAGKDSVQAFLAQRGLKAVRYTN